MPLPRIPDWAVLAASFIIASCAARATDAPELGLAGNDEVLWIFHRHAEADGTRLLRFAYRRAGDAAGHTFLPLRVPPVEGGIVQAVARGTALHVFYRDGTHKRYMINSQAWWASAAQFNEVMLPQSALPLALACDGASATLYALITARQARTATVPMAPDAAEEDDGESIPIPTAPPIPEGVDHVIVRYEGSAWRFDRGGPDDLALEAPVLQMLVLKGSIHLFYRADQGDSVVHRISPTALAPWAPPSTLPLSATATDTAAGWIAEEPVLLAVTRHGGDLGVQSFRYQGSWSAGPALVNDRNELLTPRHPLALAMFDSTIALASLNEGRDVQLGFWSQSSGRPINMAAPVAALVSRPPTGVGLSSRTMLQYAVLSAVLVGLLLWRRDSILLAVPLGPDQELAPLIRRAAALLIDLTLLFPAWGLILYGLYLRDGVSLAGYMTVPTREEMSSLAWFRPLLGGVVCLYAIALEAMTGATLGKRIAGLQVVSQNGRPRRFSAVVLRNLARIVEFDFLPLVLLIALTPGRQRLGDIFGRTVVVGTRRAPDERGQ